MSLPAGGHGEFRVVWVPARAHELELGHLLLLRRRLIARRFDARLSLREALASSCNQTTSLTWVVCHEFHGRAPALRDADGFRENSEILFAAAAGICARLKLLSRELGRAVLEATSRLEVERARALSTTRDERRYGVLRIHDVG